MLLCTFLILTNCGSSLFGFVLLKICFTIRKHEIRAQGRGPFYSYKILQDCSTAQDSLKLPDFPSYKVCLTRHGKDGNDSNDGCSYKGSLTSHGKDGVLMRGVLQDCST